MITYGKFRRSPIIGVPPIIKAIPTPPTNANHKNHHRSTPARPLSTKAISSLLGGGRKKPPAC